MLLGVAPGGTSSSSGKPLLVVSTRHRVFLSVSVCVRACVCVRVSL